MKHNATFVMLLLAQAMSLDFDLMTLSHGNHSEKLKRIRRKSNERLERRLASLELTYGRIKDEEQEIQEAQEVSENGQS